MDNKLKAYFPLIRERADILLEIKGSSRLSQQFNEWNMEQQEEFLDICTGVRGVKMLYDAFFKEVMNPDVVPELLEEFLSLILKQQVSILYMLPNDASRIADESPLLYMDIIVQLAEGSIANVEVQKVGYLFPGERCACYSADLLMRQYKRVRGEKGRKEFRYKDIKNVYTIVLFERSPKEFKAFPDVYRHFFQQKSDTGLELELLQKYVFIPLDIFQENRHNKVVEGKLDAWLMFFSSDDPEDIVRLITAYPEFKPLYEKAYDICRNMERVMGIFSEELRMLDRNTAEYMIDEMQSEISQHKEWLKETKEKLEEKRKELGETKDVLSEKKKELKEKRKELKEKSEELKEKSEELKEKSEELKEKSEELKEKSEEINEKDKELKEKREELKEKNEELKEKREELKEKNEELKEKREELKEKDKALEEERYRKSITLITQVRNFASEGFSIEKCANMLVADIDIVSRIYEAIQGHSECSDAGILELIGEAILLHGSIE